jgi:hypothetical protein
LRLSSSTPVRPLLDAPAAFVLSNSISDSGPLSLNVLSYGNRLRKQGAFRHNLSHACRSFLLSMFGLAYRNQEHMCSTRNVPHCLPTAVVCHRCPNVRHSSDTCTQDLRLWPLCIKLMRFTQYDNASDIEKGWDLLLKDAVDSAASLSAEARLQAACTATQELAQEVSPSVWCAFAFPAR